MPNDITWGEVIAEVRLNARGTILATDSAASRCGKCPTPSSAVTWQRPRSDLAWLESDALPPTLSVMAVPVDPPAVRAAALDWLRQVTMDGQLAVTRAQLENDFIVGGERFALFDRVVASASQPVGPPPCP